MALVEDTGTKFVVPKLFEKSGLQGYKIFLDRYTMKAPKGEMNIGDLCVIVTERHPKFPKKDIGYIIDIDDAGATVELWTGGTAYEIFDLISVPLETTPEQVARRVATALAASEHESIRDQIIDDFEGIILEYFIPGGRILAGAGTPGLTLNNCYVLPSPDDSRKGIVDSLYEMIETHARGGGVGLNGSSMRPRYAHVLGVNGVSSGAVSWMGLHNHSTGLVEQGGSRRGATMLMLWVWHPDILEFIDAKSTPGNFENANMSVCITDDFMRAVENDDDWDLVYPVTSDAEYKRSWYGDINNYDGEVVVYKTVKAREIWDKIIYAAWSSAEPGLHFLEHSNKMSNSYYFAPLVATNPCGEQPLPEYGVCTLGAIDLSRILKDDGDGYAIDYPRLRKTIRKSVRFLDNVIDVNVYHLPEIEMAHRNDRRIGLGTMGLGEMMIRLGIRYGSEESIEFIDELYEFIVSEAYIASSDLAAEKGSFPAFDCELYLKSGFMMGMPQRVKDHIRKNGMRNVTVMTQAPNGTTGTMMGTSTGIEPFYHWKTMRTSRLGVHEEVPAVLEEMGLDVNNLPDYCVTALDLDPMEHLHVQAILQRWIDSAISKTTNVPSEWTIEQVDQLYREAWHLGCKGITIYRDGSRHEQVLTKVVNEQTQNNNCEVCGEILIRSDGCWTCVTCGISGCERPS